MRFIELTHTDNQKLYLNIGHIESVAPDGSGASICSKSGVYYFVRESYERVKELIRWSSHRVE